MIKKIFSKEEVQYLLENVNVTKCSAKSITYSKNFKLTAINQYVEQGLSPREIFRQAGFKLEVIGKDKADDCLRRWRTTFRNKGAEGLTETRGKGQGGGRPKTRELTDADKIKRLETEVAYLKAENDFLAKLRAGKKR